MVEIAILIPCLEKVLSTVLDETYPASQVIAWAELSIICVATLLVLSQISSLAASLVYTVIRCAVKPRRSGRRYKAWF